MAVARDRTFRLYHLLTAAFEKDASDLHITVGRPPVLRIDGEITDLNLPELTPPMTESLVNELLGEERQELFDQEMDLDFSYSLDGVGRFRVNVFRQQGYYGAVLRTVKSEILPFDKLGLPKILAQIANYPRGLVLVTGPTGSGKSTTLASMIDLVNSTRACHIVTIEDPIEYRHPHKKSIVNQREISSDTLSFAAAMKHVLRQDPDVILVGEMRDPETMETAISAAETGHLVFSTLHTNDAPQSIDRVIDAFPPHQQDQIRVQLGNALRAVVAQQLLPRASGSGRAPAIEIMIGIPSVGNLVREGKTHQLSNVIQTSGQHGMQTMEQSLRDLVKKRLVTKEAALACSSRPKEFLNMLGA